jgi:Zn-dependent peptidase ImmA (M78 family)
MKPDFTKAATAAMQILIENRITETPIDSFHVLLNYPHILVMSFANIADNQEIDRNDLVPLFRDNQDAVTFRIYNMDDVDYVLIYNMRLPHEDIRRAIARELGHIVLGHDGQTRPTEVRKAEALCFAHHLLTPRPIISMIQQSGLPLTLNVLVHTTGCSSDCVEEIQHIPGVQVAPDLNRKVKELFAPHIQEYIRFHQSAPKQDNSPVIDFGSYMNGYEE